MGASSATRRIDAREINPELEQCELHRLQETLAGVARNASVSQQIEVRPPGLDEGEPHLGATFDARHLNAGLKARTGRSRPECWKHCILTLERRDATLPTENTARRDYVRFLT